MDSTRLAPASSQGACCSQADCTACIPALAEVGFLRIAARQAAIDSLQTAIDALGPVDATATESLADFLLPPQTIRSER